MMSAPDVDAAAVRDLLLRNWMTHDAMWFQQAVERHGMDEANAMNRSAVRAMAGIEAKRIRRLVGLGEPATLADVRRFFDAATALVIPEFIAYEMEWEPGEVAVRFRVTSCFAHDGVAALGLIAQYECGIFERIYGWLDALGVTYTVEPDTVRCLRHTDGACARELRLALGAPSEHAHTGG